MLFVETEIQQASVLPWHIVALAVVSGCHLFQAELLSGYENSHTLTTTSNVYGEARFVSEGQGCVGKQVAGSQRSQLGLGVCLDLNGTASCV